jgi:small basic protein
MVALLSLLAGAILAIVLQPTVPQAFTPYVAMAVVAAVDAAFGAARSYFERTFNDRIFVLAFVTNASVAFLLVFIGDQLGVDQITTAVVVVFGIRIFQNLAAIRRRVFGG